MKLPLAILTAAVLAISATVPAIAAEPNEMIAAPAITAAPSVHKAKKVKKAKKAQKVKKVKKVKVKKVKARHK